MARAMKRRGSLVLAVIAGLLAGCAQAPSAPDMRTRYLRAIEDAALPEMGEISTRLNAVRDDNPRLVWRDASKRDALLAVSWMSAEKEAKYYATRFGRTPPEKPVVWVTLVPEIRDFCRGLGQSGAALDLRLKQRIGLSADWKFDRMVEIWVDRRDLFRPCPDPETDDDRCSVAAVKGAQVPRLNDYAAFFAALYAQSYHEGGAPWTRLGYTYDWAPGAGEVGASEFMLAPDSPYEIHRTLSTDDYCKP